MMSWRPGEAFASQSQLGCIKQWPSDKAKAWTINFMQGLSQDPAIVVIAIGSSVRDVECATDLDLILLHSGKRPEFTTPPLDVDIRCYQRENVDSLLAQGHDLLGWAVRFGCVLRDPDGFWSQVRNHWQGRVALPSVEKCLERVAVSEKNYLDLLAIGDHDAAEELRLTMLTHLARAQLAKAGIFPASRPELPGQLRLANEVTLANQLQEALEARTVAA